MKHQILIAITVLGISAAAARSTWAQDQAAEASGSKHILFVAGNPSHGYGSHEHYAGCRILAETLTQRGFDVTTEVVQNGWPKDSSVLEKADSIVIYSDGGGGHPALPHLAEMKKLMDRGVGLVCLHYAVEVPKDKGGAEFKEWLGGYFETNWSVNPHWIANYKELPSHPVTAGVKPFSSNDEWYFHMRFNEDASRLTPILTAVAPESTMRRPDGPHEGNQFVRTAVANGIPQHMAWAFERPEGGRSFGFTGGHYHWNWGRPEYTQLISNAIAWTAGIDPAQAQVASKPRSVEVLSEGQDEDKPTTFDPKSIQESFDVPLTTAQMGTAPTKARLVAAQLGKKIEPAFRSPIVTSATPGHQVNVSVNVEGAKKLFLVADNAGDGISCDWADWINPTLIDADGKRTSLTDLQWVKAKAGFGEVRKNRNVSGGPLMIQSTRYDKGIGTHTDSIIEYDLPPNAKTFEAIAGLDNGGTSQNGGGVTSVQFLVFLDEAPANIGSPARGNSEQREPENAVAGLDVHPSVTAELAASEPDLLSLTNIDIDHRGRVWACEVVNYRQHRNDRPEGDRILILEDTNQDGVMDTSKVFYQGRDIDSALGICVLGNRVLVSAAPYVIEFIDKDGDDLPDSKEYVFTNTGEPQHDHSVHSFVIGPDNKLYFNFGNTGHRLCDKDGNPIKDKWGRLINDSGAPYRQGMAFRCDLDFSNMEVLGHNFRNNYELAVDSFGTVWQSDNDDDGNRATRINYVMEYGQFGYTDEVTGDSWQKPRTNMELEIPERHWHLNDPGVVPTMLITGAGSPTGITVYEGDLLPKEFQNQVIHCDAGPNVVRAYPVSNYGAGYNATILNLIEGTRDKWFRPADICVAPDGSLFVSDWYDPGVGGHLMQDTERGRLFRIAPENTPYNIPKYDFESIEGAVAALSSPSNSARYLAMQALIKFGARAESQLAAVLTSDDPRQAARALWMLASNAATAEKYVTQTLSHKNPDLRITAIRAGRLAGLSLDKIVDPLLDDNEAQVRREVALALREDTSAEMPQRWLKLANQYDGKDRWMLEALGIAAMDRWDECMKLYMADHQDDLGNAAVRDIIWRSRSTQSSSWIVKLLVNDATPESDIERLLRGLDFQPEDAKQKALQELMELATKSDSKIDQGLRDRLVTQAAMRVNDQLKAMSNEDIAAAVKRYLASLGSDPTQLAIIERLKIEGISDRLIELAMALGASSDGVKAVDLALENGGRSALEAMVKIKEDATDLQAITQAQRVAQILSLSNRGDAFEILQGLLESVDSASSVRLIAATGLSRKPNGQRYLITLAQENRLPADAATMIASTLRNARNPRVAEEAAKLFPPIAVSGTPLPGIDELAKMRGNAEEGQRLFTTVATCAQCHIVKGVGKNVGPDLSEIGDKLTREAMYVAILNPSAGISHNYEAYSALTEDGNVVTGLLVSKNDSEIILRDKDGIERKMPMTDVEEFKKLEVSLMPNNLQDLIKQQGLVDVVEYMTTLKKLAE